MSNLRFVLRPILTAFCLCLALSLVLGLLATSASAQLVRQVDSGSECSRIEPLRKKGQVAEAHAAAEACVVALGKQVSGQIGEHFPEDVAGWKRTRFDQADTMGVRSTTADYTKDGKRVRVSATGGGKTGIASALNQFNKLAAAAGGAALQVGGLPANLDQQGTVSVTLSDEVTVLRFEPIGKRYDSPQASLDAMADLIDAYPVKDIDRVVTN